ncbi:hypothetical protein QUV83_14485 [Cellulomonas cellasea]|uniref:hypothetical protein n=1 Tax=Cellulomonas cellasea TaxID=43670 RepID=UPI0025A3513B|nr:hypothetical protein [Cellulomonas cellasea]MDM8085980.1 hypothetical protein [Cellulomonas cellasea]
MARQISPYARRCMRLRALLEPWALEERRNHDSLALFTGIVRDHAKSLHVHGLSPRDWSVIVATVTERAWAAEVDPPDEDLDPEAEAFMADLRREIHGQ